ncbi:MAG: hypothetical protein DIZ78_01260 [endosymbiont of Escarpia spicata]|uniref:Uncharacterized protein n=1 Tax=endosymbiont of Escarpia spicata TaxID=2200908 RepID=A0A370DTU7_9GAMM|nr:MAG: hypothetical protein DIZ78_01260 [endosymbiont of Escarpia spicata]
MAEALNNGSLDLSALGAGDDPIAIITALLADVYALAAAEDPPIDLPGLTVDEAAANLVDTLLEIGALGGGNISKDPLNPNANAEILRMSTIVTSTSTSGTEDAEGTLVHPLLVSYAEQVIGGHELGDGSADIGDPTHVDDVFVSLSVDNGITWRKYLVGETADKSSTQVTWAGETIDYPGHSVKPTMDVNGNNIVVAWHDKYCPSGNPLNLVDPATEDTYQVNGVQSFVDYTVVEGNVTYPDGFPAPNGKLVFQVPFSCIWTARGTFNPDFDPATADVGESWITWHEPMQLTSGRRDANKVSFTSADIGIAISWQEDRQGLRSGGGEGPGDGWSGATSNHGSDIWYSRILMTDFAANVPTDGGGSKVKSVNNFAYPVRISDNESCNQDDTKLYCAVACVGYVQAGDIYHTVSDTTLGKCITANDDPLVADEAYSQLIDGDTGASRPQFTIMDNAGVPTVILAYEETKGLSERGVPDTENDIALEGKMVYFESFPFDTPVTLSPGFAVNQCVPRDPDAVVVSDVPAQCVDDPLTPSEEIFENARRVTLVTQVDAAAELSDYNFAVMYKQGFDTRGTSSDMFIRLNTGYDASTLAPMSINVSAGDAVDLDGDGSPDTTSWTADNLDDSTWENPNENTFSPRGFIRGNDIFIGFEYTPNYDKWVQGNIPNNFYFHRCVADGSGADADYLTRCAWVEPQMITQITGHKVSTLDPRLVETPAGDPAGLPSDISNPDVMFMTYGTFDQESGDELNLYYSRSVDRGVTWETVAKDLDGDGIADTQVNETLSGINNVEEKEVQSLASPDGSLLFNIWLQESEENADAADIYKALDVIFGLIDFSEEVAL